MLITLILTVLSALQFLPVLATNSNGNDAAVVCGAATLCPEGCYYLWPNSFEHNNTVLCVEVGMGYYSPKNDNNRYLCRSGTYSSKTNARACTRCDKGSFSTQPGSITCELCPQGTFQYGFGKTWCQPCNDKYWPRPGATIYYEEGGEIYCDHEERVLTAFPTHLPSSQPSSLPSNGPSSSIAPSQMPTFAPPPPRRRPPPTGMPPNSKVAFAVGSGMVVCMIMTAWVMSPSPQDSDDSTRYLPDEEQELELAMNSGDGYNNTKDQPGDNIISRTNNSWEHFDEENQSEFPNAFTEIGSSNSLGTDTTCSNRGQNCSEKSKNNHATEGLFRDASMKEEYKIGGKHAKGRIMGKIRAKSI